MASTQGIRFRVPDKVDKTAPQKPKQVPEPHLLQEQIKRTARRPWGPSYAYAFRILIFARFCAAMFSNIDDCDEVFNFWEPLHYFHQGSGFQTWEITPNFAIRSWSYIILHLPIAQLGSFISGGGKRASFFGVRIALAFLSTFAEVTLYRQVYNTVNERVARYLFSMLVLNAGMWNASSAFLPSSFAMYTTTFAFAASVAPSRVDRSSRVLSATLLFATGAIVGWPFALALASPFVLEELFVYSGDRVPAAAGLTWASNRWSRLIRAGAVAALIFIPIIAVDSIAYGKLSIVPWNIVAYNIFSDRGPNLYGTAPWTYYINNLILNFNVLTLFAFLSLPIMGLTYLFDWKRLGDYKSNPQESSPFSILALRLAPFYVWFAILTKQEHKEERFMFPAYPLLCFNAAVAVYLLRGLMETTYVKYTKSPYRASRTSLFSRTTSSIIVVSSLLSISRIFANWYYYHAPLDIMYHLEYEELPQVLNASNLLAKPLPPPNVTLTYQEQREQEKTTVDLSNAKELDLRLCFGKEWHRFPGHYLVPDGVRVDFVQSEFKGLLPGHFGEGRRADTSQGETSLTPDWWPRPETRIQYEGYNDFNQEETSHYVPVEQCDYLVDLDFPHSPITSELEPRYAVDSKNWERVNCAPFLDGRFSPLFSRILWVPGETWRKRNQWGDFCLLKNKSSVPKKIEAAKKIIP